jgi:hypothetical protein
MGYSASIFIEEETTDEHELEPPAYRRSLPSQNRKRWY